MLAGAGNEIETNKPKTRSILAELEYTKDLGKLARPVVHE